MMRMTMLLALPFFSIAIASPLHSTDREPGASDVSTGLRSFYERFDADHGNLKRFYNIPLSRNDHKRRLAFYQEQHRALEKLDFDRLSREGRVDYLLLRNELKPS